MIKPFLKKFFPPILLDIYRSLKLKKRIFTGPYPYNEIPNENVWFDNSYARNALRKLKSVELIKKYKYDYFDILTLYLNSIIEEGKSIKVLDWGGGTGRVWLNIYKNI